ncbi:hypothetical protein [Sphingomonas psychrotolerans]|uniref:Uncharacterized protein n=1 Tax=Sphingomonas psychrotolerans TaxID=1327635 RepID=A0A2K8MM34_9SPHN|nr:hypothetical protein [Sphingomonas psychrotolerans]ATY34932.1 hypothetical protein CVN68_22760 [Sphingomonas psychrotolerans]
MADRVSASIILGGTLSASDFEALCEVISAEGLSVEWDGEPFAPDHLVPGEALNLFAHEVAGGQFDELEAWCVAHDLPFVRWCGSYSGQWGPERVVFTGAGAPKSYAVSEDDVAMIDLETIERLGPIEAVLAHFAAANFTVPPLVVDVSHPEGVEHVG